VKQTVLITGAGRGIGLALAKNLLELGFTVFGGFYKVDGNLNALAASFPGLKLIPLDVTGDQPVSEAVSFISRETGGLDILINNAAIHLDSSMNQLENVVLDDIPKTFAVNVIGPLRVTKHFLPLLERGRKKLIVNISSEAGSIADCKRIGEYDYTMSKAALNMQSKILQNYLKPKGFKVLAIHPGWVRTDMGGPNADIAPQESAAGILKLILKDWGPEDGIYFDYRGIPLPW
jgi:NAD(P)-dependent dehydrogenase (short-subunit alcohol dehydrogenase family)